jgi:DNA-binding NtrC family response regulator
VEAGFRHLTVLLIDDDAPQASATRDALKELGCDVTWAINRQHAERLAKTLSPDLFIIDARLLGSADGITLGNRLWQQHRAPVIFLLEEADTGAVRQVMKIEAATSLVRPYDSTALALAIRQALKLTSGAAP